MQTARNAMPKAERMISKLSEDGPVSRKFGGISKLRPEASLARYDRRIASKMTTSSQTSESHKIATILSNRRRVLE